MHSDTGFVRYEPGVEKAAENEQRDLDEIVATMRDIVERLGDRYRHGVRAVHSKSHGVVAGKLEVLSGIDPRYAQGLFAEPGTYDVLARFSTNPADLLPDDVSTPRGFALKVVGPEGMPMLDGHESERTQDFLFVSGPVFGAPGPKDFLAQIKMFAQHLDDPEERKQKVSALTRIANAALQAVGAEPNPQLASLGGAPPSHPLGETFFTQLATRHGDYVAKYSLTPATETLQALADEKVDLNNPNCLRDAVVAFFEKQGGTWDFGAQLCANLETMPVEDGSVAWSPEESPFVTVAKLTIDSQPAYTPERRIYADEMMSFSPWHGLEAHRPLGAHNRVRRVAYPMSTDHRREENARPRGEPRDASDFFILKDRSPATAGR